MEINKENLTKLAKKLLKTKQKVFSMRKFRANTAGDGVNFFNLTDCGTIGCALGQSPSVKGLETLDSDFRQYSDTRGSVLNFFAYGIRVFGLYEISDEWEWCFSHSWYAIDNTPVGSAKRIMELVNNGLPDDWKEQMNGDEPYMFKKESKDEKTT